MWVQAGALAFTRMLSPGEHDETREGPESALSMAAEFELGRGKEVGETVEGKGVTNGS